MTASEDRAHELASLEALIGAKPTHFLTDPELDRWFDVWGDKPSRKTLIRKWCGLLDIPERYVLAANNKKLIAAYRAGRRGAEAIFKGDRPARRSFREAVGISLDDVMDSNFGLDPVIEPDPSASEEPTATIDRATLLAAIARAADLVIPPKIRTVERNLALQVLEKLDKMQAALLPAIKDHVHSEIESQGLGQHLTDEIQTLAARTARQIIEEMTPRRLDINWNGNLAVTLPAEARHKEFEDILEWLVLNEPVYVVGPKGTGKTHLGVQLHSALRAILSREDYEFLPIDQALTKYDVKGYKGPQGDYVQTLVYRAVKFGHFMLIDEGDMWAAAALGSLNSIIANGIGTFGDEVVQVHKDFRIMLCANTHGHGGDRQYVGRNPLDAASLDRFVYVEVDYDPEMEKQIYGASPWVEYVHRVRAATIALSQPTYTPSMRAISKGLKKLQNPNANVEKVCASVLWKGAAPDVIAKIKSQAGEPPRRRIEVAVPIHIEDGLDLGSIADDMTSFKQEVESSNLVAAIRILRESTKRLFGSPMDLARAKQLTEFYRDGLKPITEIFSAGASA